MALQTSIAEYFNLRKRPAVDDLKEVGSNKVMILDRATKEDASPRSVIYVESPQNSTQKLVNSLPRKSRKTPLVAVRRGSSTQDDKKKDGQSDIRKCLWPDKFMTDVKIDVQTKEELPVTVNVPFKIHSLSPSKKSISKPIPELDDVDNKETVAEDVAGGLGYTTPKKVVHSREESSIKREQPEAVSDVPSKSLTRAQKLAELKARVKNFNQGVTQLKDLRERREKQPPVSPKIQQFKTIELEVNVSPKKKNEVEEHKTASSPSLLRKAVFMSPSKSLSSSTYVSPRKLFDKPPETPSLSKPAYQKYYDLASSGKPALPLPYSYRCLAETFRSVDMIVSMMFNRKEDIVFHKLKASVQQVSKKNLTKDQIGQIVTVMPSAYELKREKVKILGHAKDQYELVLKPILSIDDAPSYNSDRSEKGNSQMSPSLLLQRRRQFYNSLLEKAKGHHEVFLTSLSPPLSIPKEKLMRWHPDFDIDSCPDIHSSTLPTSPVHNKLSSARDVLIKAKDMFSANNRMEKALERLSGNHKPQPMSETAAATAALAKALKGIPKSLLEKVRAKQAAKTAALLTRCPEETKRRLEFTRLPELARILRNIFVLERKNVISLTTIVEKVSQSYREVLSQDDTIHHIRLIMESVPGWINEITDGDKKYLRLSRDADFARITAALNKLISDNQVNL